MQYERAPQEEQNGTILSSVAPSSEEYKALKDSLLQDEDGGVLALIGVLQTDDAGVAERAHDLVLVQGPAHFQWDHLGHKHAVSSQLIAQPDGGIATSAERGLCNHTLCTSHIITCTM